MIAVRQPGRRHGRNEGRPPARVVVHPELLRSIAAASALAGDDETGGPLLGTVQRSWEGATPTLIVAVLGTVPPGPDLDSGPGSVALGHQGDGERAAAALRWWRSATGLELLHVGDWHRHPAYHPEPSAGDRATAREMSVQCSASLWLVAVTVGEQTRCAETEVDEEVIRRVSDRSQVDELRIYEADPRTGLLPATVRVDGCALPRLPELPWHLARPGRFGAECRLLAGAGFTLGLKTALRGDHPVVELLLGRDGDAPLTVITGPDFPDQAPCLRDKHDRPVPVRGGWSAARFLVDVVEEAGQR